MAFRRLLVPTFPLSQQALARFIELCCGGLLGRVRTRVDYRASQRVAKRSVKFEAICPCFRIAGTLQTSVIASRTKVQCILEPKTPPTHGYTSTCSMLCHESNRVDKIMAPLTKKSHLWKLYPTVDRPSLMGIPFRPVRVRPTCGGYIVYSHPYKPIRYDSV